jgi:hypothetical protein
LSRRALRLGASLRDCGVAEVATFLYMYNRAPARSYDELVDSHTASLPGRAWRDAGVADGWRTFVSPTAEGFAPEQEMAKLYVSPQPRNTAEAVQALVAAFATGPKPLAFKVAATADGICRPDKVVVYFAALDALVEAASRLAPVLASVPAQGVPFTAALTTDGLLSWGIDPPARVAGGGGNRHSWRSWVTYRLAHHLVAAGGPDPVAAVTEEIRRDGVDPLVWQPEPGVWERARRGGPG